MQKRQIIKLINTILKGSWTSGEARDGKNVPCLVSWRHELKEIVFLYKEKGWLVEKRVEISSRRGRQHFLNFRHPSW